MTLVCGDEGIDPTIVKGHLVTIDYDAPNGNTPRFKLNHATWVDLVHSDDPTARRKQKM